MGGVVLYPEPVLTYFPHFPNLLIPSQAPVYLFIPCQAPVYLFITCQVPVYLFIPCQAPVYLLITCQAPVYLFITCQVPVYLFITCQAPVYLFITCQAPVYLFITCQAPVYLLYIMTCYWIQLLGPELLSYTHCSYTPAKLSYPTVTDQLLYSTIHFFVLHYSNILIHCKLHSQL